jgi:DNA processing protein
MFDISKYSQTAQMLALCRFASIGPRQFDALFAHFGSLPAIFAADLRALMGMSGMSDVLAEKVRKANEYLPQAEQYEAMLVGREIGVTTRLDERYGHLLFELNDPPTLLYVRGQMPAPETRSVALVGATNAGGQGIALTTALAKQFAAKGVQVVSSLSGGIDAAAHLGSRAGGGSSFAVLDTGFDHLDQSAQMPLAIDIVQAGGVISEYAAEFKGTALSLKESNRLLAGLSQAVVVTELYHDSARTLDLLEFCQMIGKLAFIVSDLSAGLVTDQVGFGRAVACGAIPLDGLAHVDDIVKALV